MNYKTWRKNARNYFKGQRKNKNKKYRQSLAVLSSFSARNLKKLTPAEIKFEKILSNFGLPYRIQPYYCQYSYSCLPDFVIEHPYYLVLEVDGEYHSAPAKIYSDLRRDSMLGRRGYKTARFTNAEVFENPKAVENKLRQVIGNQYKLNKNCQKQRSIFHGGAFRAMKPAKPIKVLRDSDILAENPRV